MSGISSETCTVRSGVVITIQSNVFLTSYWGKKYNTKAINMYKVDNSEYTSITCYTQASSSPHIPLPEPEARYSTKPSHKLGLEKVQ